MKFRTFTATGMRILTGETAIIYNVVIADATPLELTVIGHEMFYRKWYSWESEAAALAEARADLAGRLARIAGTVEELEHAIKQPPEPLPAPS